MLKKYWLGSYLYLAPEGDPPAGGDLTKDLEAARAETATLKAELEKLKSVKPPEQKDDLVDQADKIRAAEEKTRASEKEIRSAMKFSLEADKFLKDNSTLLPKEVADIFKLADKEKYDSEIEKTNAIKAGVIKEFFKVQSNLDLLTAGYKTQLDDYLKLTNTGKQEKAAQVYDNILEPALEMLRRIKKAEALNKGFGTSGAGEDAYKNKMHALSKSHYGVGDKK